MKRSRGRREKIEKKSNIRYLFYSSLAVLVIMIVTFIITYIVYTNKIKSSNYSELTAEKIAELVPNATDLELEKASTDIGKSIEEVINSTQINNEETSKSTNNNNTDKKEDNNKIETKTIQTNVKTEVIKDPVFSMPVEGEILREFSKDNLIYSETLKEWITHLGIDIKAQRTSIVKASEEGKIESIKNDPRYGLTIIISHTNGYKSIYSNLLTSEFVKEGDTVKKGQSIGTVGNSASFEIADEPHLHFEILKDGVQVDPNIYIK